MSPSEAAHGNPEIPAGQQPATPEIVVPPAPPGESPPEAVHKTQAVADALIQLGDQADPQRVSQALKAQTGIDLDLDEVAAIVAEAPVVIIAGGRKEQWKTWADEVFQEGVRRGAGKGDPAKQKQGAFGFLSSLRMDVWVNRHTMIALTTMMLVAEAYGFDTAPMEGFDAAGVKREFSLPDDAEVVALLAIGRAAEPDKVYPGRFGPERAVFAERYGTPWPSGNQDHRLAED